MVKTSLSLCLVAVFILIACGRENRITANAETVGEAQLIDVEVSAGNLSGAFINAGQGTPIVIIVPGSGPTDRDGNNQGMRSNALKFLATALEISGQNCAYLLGHSEGGLMVSAAALEQNNVCGVITVAAPGFRASNVLRAQLKANPANKPILKQAENAIAALEAGQRVDVSKMHSALQGLFNPKIQDFWISVFAVDPAQILAAVDAPKLIIQGEHDLQVSKEDAQRLSEASGGDLILVPKMNHVLKTAPKRRSANFKAYNSPDTPIDDRVTDAAAAFIHKHR